MLTSNYLGSVLLEISGTETEIEHTPPRYPT